MIIEPMVIGIGGVSRAGKTSLALKIREWLGDDEVCILHQDEFIHPLDQMPQVEGHIDWEHPNSIDFKALTEKVKKEKELRKYVVIEGLMVFWSKELISLMDKKIYLKISKKTFLSRKTIDNRWEDEPAWYIEHIWDNHFIYGTLAEHESNTLQLDGEASSIDSSTKKFLGIK